MVKKSRLEKAMEKPGKQYVKQLKDVHEMEKYGHKVPAGHMYTVQDMQRYFRRKK